MSFYDDASIVMIPSGYKTSKLYSQKPTDGSGDLVFTRTGSTATRVGPDGLIEKVRTNLVVQSEGFDTASWNKTNDGQVTITANAAVAPNGTTTAEKMIPSAIAGFHCVAQTITLSASEFTISVFAKAAENSFLQIFDSLTTDFANFNLTTGAVGSTDSYVASIQSAGNGWFRCTATKAVPSSSFGFRYGVVTTATAVRGESFTGNGTNGLLIWGAQLESGVATPYIPTTTAAVSVGPIANMPRLDYTGGGCPKLLMEPTRTNVVLYSQQFDNAAWTKVNTTVTANYATSPDGYMNADRIVFGVPGYMIQNFSGTYTASIYVKGTAGETIRFGVGSNVSQGALFTFTGEWQRIVNVGTVSTTLIFLSNFSGATATDFLVWGAQLEAGAYATSYIPTLNASVTRNADSCSKTGISSLIGQTEGVIFWEGVISQPSENGNTFSSNLFNTARNANTNTAISIAHISSTNNLVVNFFIGNGTLSPIFILNSFSIPSGTYIKLAFAYKSGQSALYVNGVSVLTSSVTFTSITTMSEIYLADRVVYYGYSGNPSTNQLLLFKTRLSNAELATLTTL